LAAAAGAVPDPFGLSLWKPVLSAAAAASKALFFKK
jgi:hypothetical protein